MYHPSSNSIINPTDVVTRTLLSDSFAKTEHDVIDVTSSNTIASANSSVIAGDDEQYARKVLRTVFSVAYFILFVFGTFGNGIVIVMIVNVMTVMRRARCRTNIRKINPSSTKHVFIYILGLSVVDLLVIIHLPFLIVDLLYGQWLFGVLMCKLYWFGECVNKLLSSFIMTILSWDRYLAVCSPIRSFRIRSNEVACFVLVLCSVLATLLLLPVLLNATVIHLDILQAQPLADDSSFEIIDSAKEQHQTVTKCMFDGTSSFFIFYTFGCGFVLPALLITYFYTRVIFRLQKSVANIRRNSVSSKNSGSTSRVQQVTKRIVAVILFYFFCWTPQWILNLLSHFSLITVSWSTLTLSSIFFAAHLLVCFNSATNPILYALINRELRQQHVQAMLKRRRSISNATNHALDFIAKHSHSGLNPFYNDAQQRQQQQQQPQQTLRASNHSLIALVGFKKTPALRRQRSSSCDSLKSAQAKSAVLSKRASTSSTITENSPSAIRHKSTNALSTAQQYFKDDLSKPQQSDTTIQINCVTNTGINITLAVPSNLITENLNANKTPAAIASYRSRKQKQLPSSSLLGDQNIAAELLSYDDHVDDSNKHYLYERSSNVQRRSSASENVMLLKYECFHSNDESLSIEELHSNKLRNADSSMKEDCLMRSTAVPIKFEPNDALL